MKKILFCVLVALTLAIAPSKAQDLAVYESVSKLSFAVPDNAVEIQDDREMILVQTPDNAFVVQALPFPMQDATSDDIAEALVAMAAATGIDLGDATQLSFENTDIVGSIFAVKDADDILYVYGVCGNDYRGFLIQVISVEDYHPFVDSLFETISIED